MMPWRVTACCAVKAFAGTRHEVSHVFTSRSRSSRPLRTNWSAAEVATGLLIEAAWKSVVLSTGTAPPAEVMAIGASPDYVYCPELADDPRRARRIEGTEFEIVTELVERGVGVQGAHERGVGVAPWREVATQGTSGREDPKQVP